MRMDTIKATKPTRLAISERMKEFGDINKDFVVFEADLGYSTYSYLFGDMYPGRYFNMGIAESNAMAASAGMAASGRSVVVCSYGVFASMRALEAVRTLICYPNLNVKILASHGGITAAIDGVTHQATEDIGFMTTLPNMKVMVPSDSESSRKLFDVSINTPGPFYIRLNRDPLYEVYLGEEKFRLGGSNIIREGKDATVVSYGDILFQALEAAEELKNQGISVEVIDMYSIKPFDKVSLLKSITKTGALVVAENHQKRNGLGYELSNFCLKNKFVRFDNLGLSDTFAESGDYYQIIEKYGFSKRHIVDSVKRILKQENA